MQAQGTPGRPDLLRPLARRSLLLGCLLAVAGCRPGGEQGVSAGPSPASGAPAAVTMTLRAGVAMPEDTIEGVAYAPDGSRIATALADGAVAVWDPGNLGEAVAARELHTTFVSSVAWSPDGTLLATASTDGVVRIDRPTLAEPRGRLATVFQRFAALCWSPDGTQLAVARGEGAVDVYDAQSLAAPLYSLPVGGQTTDVAWSPSGSFLAAGNRGGDLMLASPAARRVVRTVSNPPLRDVSSIAWAPDGARVAVGYAAGTVLIVDPQTGATVRTLGPLKQVNAVAWSPDGQVVATTSLDFDVQLWAVATGRRIGRAAIGYDTNGVSWSPDGSQLAVGTDNHTLLIYGVSPALGPPGATRLPPATSRSYMPQ